MDRMPAVLTVGGNIREDQKTVWMPDRTLGELKTASDAFRIARFDQRFQLHGRHILSCMTRFAAYRSMDSPD